MNWQNKLDEMKLLEKGWNSYDADPPSILAIEKAKSFLDLLPTAARVSASAMGGVGVTYKNKKRKAYVEFYNNGTYHMLVSDGINMRTGTDTYEELIKTINEYLKDREILTKQVIDDIRDLRDLDWLIAYHITDLNGLGYYRRESSFNQEWELCNKGDITPDFPLWKASMYYKPNGMLFTVPYYSTDSNLALAIVRLMINADREYANRFMFELGDHKHYGTTDYFTFMTIVLNKINAESICRAALCAVMEH